MQYLRYTEKNASLFIWSFNSPGYPVFYPAPCLQESQGERVWGGPEHADVPSGGPLSKMMLRGILGSHFQSWKTFCKLYCYSTNETRTCYIIYMANSFIHSFFRIQIFNMLQALCQAQCEQTQTRGWFLRCLHGLLTTLVRFRPLRYFPCLNQGRPELLDSSSPTLIGPSWFPVPCFCLQSSCEWCTCVDLKA